MPPPTPYPMQPQMPPAMQPPAQYPMPPPMQPLAQYPMPPPMQYSAPPKPSKRGLGAWAFVIGGFGALLIILVAGVGIVLYFGGSSSAWKAKMETERKAFREGRYLDAVNLAQAELKEAETLGSQDPHLATSLHNAGELYTRLERYDEAERYFQRALSIRKNEDAETARTICALARLNYSRGNRDKAERLYRQSLAIREKVLGKEHPDVAESLSGLAGVLALKQIGEAEQLARRQLAEGLARRLRPPYRRDHRNCRLALPIQSRWFLTWYPWPPSLSPKLRHRPRTVTASGLWARQ